jgi:RNA polymerase sigma-70 factor (ECF subfamily)
MTAIRSKHEPDSASPSDAELVARVVARDEQALATLYDRYSGLLLAVTQRILGGAGDAEEILQEAFLQAWKQADRYDRSRSSVSNWLSLIARSRAIDRLRSRKVMERTAVAAQVEKGRSDESPKGVANVLMSERRQRLRAALAELPAEQREVIELAFFKGMTQSEISGQTGTPLGTVKTRTLLAMKKLRKALQADLEELL